MAMAEGGEGEDEIQFLRTVSKDALCVCVCGCVRERLCVCA
ncbi:unnamed protein product, partial [Tetraodon nigroviridis]